MRVLKLIHVSKKGPGHFVVTVAGASLAPVVGPYQVVLYHELFGRMTID